MHLQDYLQRIHFNGEPAVDLATLRQLHHQHLLHIPYENLSVQLGEPVGLAHSAAFDKIVHQQRGGWCYEMNGLLQWALQQIGFKVMRISGGVLRSQRGESAVGNHLVLAVLLEQQTWIADVGLGDGLREPIALKNNSVEQGGLHYKLEKLDDYWRLHNHQYGSVADFDFKNTPADEALLKQQCDYLQQSEQSPFVMNLVCQKFTEHSIEILLGKVRRTITPKGVTKKILTSANQLQNELVSVFGLDRDISALWPKIEERHQALQN